MGLAQKATPYMKICPTFLVRCPICRRKELEVGFCEVFEGWTAPENWIGNECEASCLHCGALGTGPDYDSAITAVKGKETKMKHSKHRRGKGKRRK